MKSCVFVGPSSGEVALPRSIDRYTPASLGSIWRAVEQGYERIGLVDGLFGAVPAVWHKEILHALCQGVTVYGASSMGALRAAELHDYGMVGVGAISRLYRAGCLMDDDEVCLVHASREGAFRPLSLPMVSIRRTLSRMTRAQELSPSAAAEIRTILKRHHFADRTFDTLRGVIAASTGSTRAAEAFETRYEDLKVRDYQALVNAMTHSRSRLTGQPPPWRELETSKWYVQFVLEAEHIPELEPW